MPLSHWFRSSRFAEICIASSTWIILTLPLWLAPFHPAVTSYLIIAFDIYFLTQSFKVAIRAIRAYMQLTHHESVPYAQMIRNLPDQMAISLHHVVVVPCYKESVEKVSETLQCIAHTDYPWPSHIHIVIGCEAREAEAPEKVATLQRMFHGRCNISATYHILTDDEVPGKASNQTHAVRQIHTDMKQRGIADENVLITVADADSKLPANYFSILTHRYINDVDRLHHFYWAPVLLYNNFWDLPFFVRIQASLASVLRLAHLMDGDRLIQISTYSTSLHLLNSVGFWDTDIVPEDWHIYLQAYFAHGDKVKTIPLFTIINGDAVNAGGLLNSFKTRYEQEKRWAWGVSDLTYMWTRMFDTPHIPLRSKVIKFLHVSKVHLLWPTSFFILTVFASIITLINPEFKRTVMGFVLPQVSGLILTLSSSMLIIYTILDIKIRSKLDIKTRPHNLIFLALQWYILPIISFALSALPALDAHTRMLFGKKLIYKVTEKK